MQRRTGQVVFYGIQLAAASTKSTVITVIAIAIHKYTMDTKIGIGSRFENLAF